jgi:hypothetical protein
MLFRTDRLPQPPHSELDIRRLQVSPPLDLGLISILGLGPISR